MLVDILIALAAIMLSEQQTSALGCNQPVSPTSYQLIPSPHYSGTFMLNSAVEGCELLEVDQETLRCDYNVILGDGVKSSLLVDHISFKDTPIEFDFTGAVSRVTAIDLYFFNNPGNGISLPDIVLLAGPESVKYTIVDNQYLSQGDAQIRASTIRLLTPLDVHDYIRLKFQFFEFYDFEWMLLSEVAFCNDSQPNYSPQEILFRVPSSTIIQPKADDVRDGLVCTVSSQGSYTWQWEKDNSVIGNGDPNYDITIGDGSRTTKLMISNLNFSDAGQYKCRVTLNHFNITSSRIYDIFSEIVSLTLMMCGYNASENVTVTCELHGYQSSFSPPVWFSVDGSEIATSDKYTISSSDGVNTIVLENGTTLPSVVVSLTIHNLTSADEGDYTCRGTRRDSVTRLTADTERTLSSPHTMMQPTPSTSQNSSCVVEQCANFSNHTVIQPTPSTYQNLSRVPEQCTNFSSAANSIIIVMGIVILVMTVTILSLLVIATTLLRRGRKFSASAKLLDTSTAARWVVNDTYSSETDSVDSRGYQIVSQIRGTHLSLNNAYNKRTQFVPTESSNIEQEQSHLVSHTPDPESDCEEIQLQSNIALHASVDEDSDASGYDDVIVFRNKWTDDNAEQSSETSNETPAIVAKATVSMATGSMAVEGSSNEVVDLKVIVGTTSTDTVQYETIPESSAITTLSRNSAYQQSVVWLPEGNTNLREQVPPSEAMTEMDSADGGTITRQQEPSDYLLAVSTKTNTTDMENTMKSVESEDRERERNSPDLVNLLLVSSEEDGQIQEVYLQRDRGSNQEVGEEPGELEEQRSDAEKSVQGEQRSTAASTDQSEVGPIDKSVH